MLSVNTSMGVNPPLSAMKFKACLIRRAFLFISNGKLCFYIYHFIPFTVWMIFVAISPFISPVTVPDRSRTGLYHRNAGVFNRRAEIRSCADDADSGGRERISAVRNIHGEKACCRACKAENGSEGTAAENGKEEYPEKGYGEDFPERQEIKGNDNNEVGYA